jgi:peptide chain release factor 3
VVSQLRDDAELLDHAAVPFDRERFLKGEMTPVFFGSALTNFGVEFFLNSFLDLAPPPGPRLSDRGPVPSERPEFAGVVFKIQANLDPRHHDCVAFMRVCAGTFSRDMDAVLARTGERIRIKRSQRLFANQRETMEFAFPGDVVGLTLPGQLRLGDTLGVSDRLQFVGQWQFPPECFATLSCTDTSRRKQFDKGLEQLVGEGAIQRLRDPHAPTQEPVLAAVGQLQFDVVQYRLEAEYNARTTVRHLPYRFARWVTGSSEDLAAIRIPTVARLYEDDTGHPVVVIETEGMLRYCQELNPKLTFAESRPITNSLS